MLTSAALVKQSARLLRRAASPQVFATRSFALKDTLNSKEKHEEDRFMREQEKKFFEKKKQELDAIKHKQELAQFEAVVAPCMAEIHAILAKTGDDVSNAGYEALAKWKLGIK